MKKPSERDAANDNSLHRDAALSLRLLHWFLENREEAIAEFIGPHYRPDPLRDELMRTICLNFADGRTLRLEEYQRALAHRWSDAPLVPALNVLLKAGLVTVDGERDGAAAGLIRPTKRLISFYNRNMPMVLDIARKMLAEVEPSVSRSLPRDPD